MGDGLLPVVELPSPLVFPHGAGGAVALPISVSPDVCSAVCFSLESLAWCCADAT